jgi:hypothetical protein
MPRVWSQEIVTVAARFAPDSYRHSRSVEGPTMGRPLGVNYLRKSRLTNILDSGWFYRCNCPWRHTHGGLDMIGMFSGEGVSTAVTEKRY